MTDKVQKILSKIATRKLCTMDEHMAFYNDKAKEDYWFLSEIEEFIKASQEEPVSEDLEKEMNKMFPILGHTASTKLGFYDIARHFANWQKQKNESKVLTEEQCRKIRDDAFELGKDAMKQQLMAKAVDGVVHHFEKCGVASVHYTDPTGVPMAYFTSPEGLSAGDKIKIIVIKED